MQTKRKSQDIEIETDCWILQEGWQAVNISIKRHSHLNISTSGLKSGVSVGGMVIE